MYCIECVGIHEVTYLDHAVEYIDWDTALFTKGLVNHQVRTQGRLIHIKQSNTIKKHLETLIPRVESHHIQTRAAEIVASFVKYV